MKQRLLIGLVTAVLASVLLWAGLSFMAQKQTTYKTVSVQAGNLTTAITADGTVHSAQEAQLHFTTNGKLVSLPFKEGDTVRAGQTIAQLDTYTLQQQLAVALNAYRANRDSFDQTNSNAANGIIQGQQAANISGKNVGVATTNPITDSTLQNNAVNDMVKRIVDENQASLDTSVASVNLANYALQLASLTSPFTGIITHEDVTVSGQNVTTGTTFSVADPTNLVFRANVSVSDRDKLALGAQAVIHLAGNNATYAATVSHIYPQKVTLPSGQDVYQVDVTSPMLSGASLLSNNGTVTITSNVNAHALIVPTWLILNHKSIWVLENNKPILHTVTIGTQYTDTTEIISGLKMGDRVILNPESIAHTHYILL